MKKIVKTKLFDQFKGKPYIAKIKDPFSADSLEIDLATFRFLIVKEILLKSRSTLCRHLDAKSVNCYPHTCA